jgi:hypothetical protein
MKMEAVTRRGGSRSNSAQLEAPFVAFASSLV